MKMSYLDHSLYNQCHENTALDFPKENDAVYAVIKIWHFPRRNVVGSSNGEGEISIKSLL